MTEFPVEDETLSIEARHLVLVDRIIGLEAQIANLNSLYSGGKAAREQVDAVRNSTTWRIGRVVMSPFILVSRILERSRKS